jgi:hypothetical protein
MSGGHLLSRREECHRDGWEGGQSATARPVDDVVTPGADPGCRELVAFAN